MNERGFKTRLCLFSTETPDELALVPTAGLTCDTVRRVFRAAPPQPGSRRSSGADAGALPLPVGRGPTAEPPEPTVRRPGVRVLLCGRSDQARGHCA